MNKVVLVGRLTAKPELVKSEKNSYTKFALAVKRDYANADGSRETDFINIIAWGKNAETIAKYLDKGNLIALDGRIQTGSYDNKDGNKVYTTDVVLEGFDFIESKKETTEEKPAAI